MFALFHFLRICCCAMGFALRFIQYPMKVMQYNRIQTSHLPYPPYRALNLAKFSLPYLTLPVDASYLPYSTLLACLLACSLARFTLPNLTNLLSLSLFFFPKRHSHPDHHRPYPTYLPQAYLTLPYLTLPYLWIPDSHSFANLYV